MPITRADFPKLTEKIQSIFNEVASGKVSDNVGFSLFNVFDTEMRTYEHLVLHGVAGIKRVTPGQNLPKLSTKEGDSVQWTQEYFGGEVGVNKDMRKFDLYNQIEGICRTITEDAFDSVDQSLADKLIHGWITTYTDVYGDTVTSVGPDSLSLFSAAHSNNINSNVFSNIITDGTNTNPPLSRQAIMHMRALGLVHKDPNGKTRPIKYDILLVPPSLEDMATRICNSQYLPGSANNDINPLYGKIKVVVWARLETASDGTDASAYWYLLDSSRKDETLQCLFAERPSLDAPEEVYENKDWNYTLDYFYAIGFGYPAYVAGSKGDKS
jgi:hypothetical protein